MLFIFEVKFLVNLICILPFHHTEEIIFTLYSCIEPLLILISTGTIVYILKILIHWIKINYK